ncbi:uncharacterized protein LOC135473036 [Liolophura sinensis]|uniref:uncharacterized protein LOC135473036 n=1 Tax=Liolophura sinensis TaxID=3198878 RepID=UPI003158A6E1
MNQQPHDVFDSPSSHTNGYSTTAKPQVHRTSSSVRRTPVRSALDILADKIASAVIRESPLATDFKDSTDNTPTLLTPDFNLDNPADAMDESVFASRDLIGRSPVGVFVSSHTPRRPVTSDTEAHLRTSEFRSFLIEEDEDKENEIDKFDIQRDKERLSKTETEVYHRCNNDKPQVIRGTMDHVDTSDDNMDSVPPGLELSPSPSPVVPEKPSHKPGSGDFEDDSVFVPVQEGLQYTSPYRPKMSGQAESLHEKIERYKQLRSTILSNVTSQKSPEKQEMIEEVKAMSSPGFSRNPDDPVQHLYISDQDDALGCEEAKHSPVDTTKNHWVSHTPERQYRLTPAHREELYSLQVDDLLDLNTSKTDFSSSDGRPHTTARLSTSLQDFSMGKKMEEDFLHEEPFSKNHLIPFDLDLDIEGDSQGMSRIGPLKTQSPNNSSRADRHVTFSPKESPDSYKQLFSLDVEDLDFGDVRHSKETEYGAKSSPTHAGKSPILDDSCLFLDSSLNLEGSFLVS